MTRYYGVKCETCQTSIPLGIVRIGDSDPDSLVVRTPNLDGNRCPSCKSTHVYSSAHIIEWDGKDDLI